jgi:hypothetical protein
MYKLLKTKGKLWVGTLEQEEGTGGAHRQGAHRPLLYLALASLVYHPSGLYCS